MKCTACGLFFFNPRLEPDEEARLYSGYRGAEYQSVRQHFEPWYTQRFNASITSAEFLELRKTKIREILQKHLSAKQSWRILDFGGAQGELVLNLIPGAEPYVYDVSGVESLDGVHACAGLDECRNQNFDLIICSNVLEHLGSPRRVIDQIRQVATPDTLVWVDVPHESPCGSTLVGRRLLQTAVLALTRPRVALSLAKPGALYLMHEHVNFFGEQALRCTLGSAGWTVAESGSYGLRGPLGRQEWVWALARAAR
jgi:SAM-dependent methyltransferase